MTIEEKMLMYEQIFWRDFINITKNTPGFCIPVQQVTYDQSLSPHCFYVGDGTINIALLIALLSVIDRDNAPVGYDDCLETLHRLSDKAYSYFSEKFDFIDFGDVVNGFFVRDDYDYKTQDVSWGSYRMLETLDNEDPCHSPFTSQDQVWNLNTALCYIMVTDKELSSEASRLGSDLNEYIKSNGYKIYNPYLSRIRHFFNCLPPMNERKVAPWERQSYRDEHFKLTEKVKRGANNWYYSGGTSACLDTFNSGKKTYKNTIRTFLYKIEIAFLDRIYEPLYRLLTKKDFKHNSYYCYGACSGIWYGDYKKRFLQQFEKHIKDGELFEPNIVPFVIDYSELSDNVKKYLDSYFEKLPSEIEPGVLSSPIENLIIWNWMRCGVH